MPVNPNIPVWDGNPEVLPKMGEKFLYRERVWTWRPCDCGGLFCHRPTAYDVHGKKSRSMNIRLRGSDPGYADVLLLIKIGASTNEIADAYERGGQDGLATVLERYMAKDPVGKGIITQSELTEHLWMAAMESIEKMTGIDLVEMLG